jgi:hypothetical protein
MLFRLLATAIACAVISACASSRTGPTVPASEVQIYNSTQLIPTQYTVVERIWIDPTSSAFSYPSFANPDDAIQAMRQEAGQAGATGILNIMCMNGDGWKNGRQLCYGDAIKFVSTSK